MLPANPGPCGIWSLKGRDILCLAVALIYYGVSTDLESLGMSWKGHDVEESWRDFPDCVGGKTTCHPGNAMTGFMFCLPELIHLNENTKDKKQIVAFSPYN